MRLLNTDGKTLLLKVSLANTFFTRARGLLFSPPLKENEGLWIKPCNSVHTFFMSYPIDVVFLDSQNRIMCINKSMPPWRTSRIVKGAKSVLEINSGAAEKLRLEIGDSLDFAN